MTNCGLSILSNPRAELARRNFSDFISYTKTDYEFNWHHLMMCDKLQQFTDGRIKKLMIFAPPQTGKSEISTRRYPAFQLGKKPKTKMAICSYSATLAASFNRDIQRIIDEDKYYDVFPDTVLNESNVATSAQGSFLRNSEIFEIVNHRGFVKTVGVGGSLTGTPIDIGIIDDPFKDREEAMSVRIREKVWSWYTDVFESRLHNDSQQLVCLTRWDQDDLAGRILKRDGDAWTVVIFPAIKERDNEYDPRKVGEALWPSKHSLDRMERIRETSPITFNSLYQQEPRPSSEALVFPEWSEYEDHQEPDSEAVIGLDFGFSNDPNGIVQVRIQKDSIYLKELLYEKGLTNSQLAFKMEFLGLKKKRIIADCAEPKTIEEFKKERGFNIVGCTDKGIVSGIAWIKDRKIFVHKNSHNLKNELSNYQYVMVGGESTNYPIDSFNHLIDSIRYTRVLFKQGKSSSGSW